MPKRNKIFHMIVSHIARDLYQIEAYNETDAENLMLTQLREEDELDSPEIDEVWQAEEADIIKLPEGLEIDDEEAV